MASWEHELAKKLKENTNKAKKKATNESTFFMGVIEQKSPLIISLESGDLMYEEDEIIKTKTFASRTINKGDSVICLPAEGLGTIVAIDVEG